MNDYTSLRKILRDSPTKWSLSKLMGWSTLSPSWEQIGEWITGPFTSSISNGTPNAGRGVSMSEKIITPSGRKDFHGCKEISTMRSVVSDLSLKDGYFSASFLYTAIYLPAWRIIHAGGLLTGSPLAAWTRSGSGKIIISNAIHLKEKSKHQQKWQIIDLQERNFLIIIFKDQFGYMELKREGESRFMLKQEGEVHKAENWAWKWIIPGTQCWYCIQMHNFQGKIQFPKKKKKNLHRLLGGPCLKNPRKLSYPASVIEVACLKLHKTD